MTGNKAAMKAKSITIKVLVMILTLYVFSNLVGCVSTQPSNNGNTHFTDNPLSSALILSELAQVTELPEIESIISGEFIVGKNVYFGGYNWIVLDLQKDKALIISEKVLEHRAYHEMWEYVRWEGCTLRGYLNDEFLSSTFSVAEQSRILEAIVINNDNPWYGTDGGNNTIDKVFILSLEEIVEYFGDSGQLENQPLNDGKYSWVTGTHLSFIHDQYDMKRMVYDLKGVTT